MSHFKVDPAVTDKFFECVLVDEFFRDVGDFDVDISSRSRGVLRLKSLRSKVAKRAPRWESTLLMRSLTSLSEPVGVPTSLGYAMLMPPMVMGVRLAATPFLGRTLQTTLE